MRLWSAPGVLLLLWCCGVAAAQTPTPVLTQAYDAARDGLNATETTLTPANVSPATFGKLFNLPVDGFLYAQPLYVPGVAIAGGTHNVVYVATMHDSVYAFDADGLSTQPLWHVSFINPAAGITTEPQSDNTNTTDTDGETGILGTPVIDSSTGTLYVVAKTNETSGGTTNRCFRLHALDITSGAERTGSPTACIAASVTGTGSPNSGGKVQFTSYYTLQRPGLALSGNDVYAAFGSWGDDSIWHGWVLGFDKSTLQLAYTLNITPNGTEGEGGIWASGRAPAVDASGNLFVTTGNGNFDGVTNFGDSILKLSPTLGVTDYFTPYNQQGLDSNDLDISSAGVVLLPNSAGTSTHPHIMIACGKDGAVYVVDRDNLGQFNSHGDSQIIQELNNAVGGLTVNPNNLTYVENCYSGAAYWNGNVYFGGITDSVKQFTFSNGLLSTSPVARTPEVYQFPGANAVISANGTTNGILWAIENAGNVDAGRAGTAVLHAYDATNIGTELYSSNQSATDAAGGAVKFTLPTVTNGKVYVGTQSSVAVYGLFSSMPQASTPTFSPAGGNYSSSVSVTITDASPGTTIYYTTDGSTPTISSSVYSGPIVLSKSATVNAIAVGAGYRYSAVGVSTYTINGASPITFAQVAAATPQSSVSTVTLSYPSAEAAGDLNIVVVGWNDATASVQSVTDSAGNTYQLAVGPTSGTTLRQSIYYASGIRSGSDTVTVTFNQAAVNPDIRILEYRGVTTLDATAAASGSGTTASSGSATIHSNSELIFGANTVHTGNSGAGTGFTARIITSPDSDLAEDKTVTSTGSYSATAPLTSSGAWVMQMATFSAAPPTPTPATMTSPAPGSTLTGPSTTFTWTTGSGVTYYYLWIGSTAGGNDLYQAGTSGTSATMNLPTSGATIYVRLWSVINGGLQYNDYTYTEFTPVPATMVSPAPGSTLSGSSTTFTWTTGSGVSSYYLWIGTTAGGNDLYQAGTSGTSATMNLPTNGATIFVRLWSVINGGLQYHDYTYTEFNSVAAMISPTPGSTLTGSSTTFTWTAGSGTYYYLWIGTTAGGNDLYQAGTSGTSATMNLPTNGATIYVRLWSVINGGLQYHDYTYTEFNSVAAMISPAPGSTLTGSSTTFTWTAGSGTYYYLWIGTTAGGNDLYQAGTSGTSATMNLPTNGATIYVRLWSVINGGLQYRDYTYTEFTPVPAAMISPAPGSTLTGSSTTFTWTTGSGVSYYYLWIGTTAGGNDLYQAGSSGTSATMNLPTNGATIYVRLWSVINGGLQYYDYTYTEF